MDRGNYEDRHPTDYQFALVKFNYGSGALLCNKCNIIIRTGFDLSSIEDKKHFCEKHTPTNT